MLGEQLAVHRRHPRHDAAGALGRTKVFQAAIIGRGSVVVITVSSMSLMMPCVTVVPTTSTGTSMVLAPGDPT